MSDKEDQKKKKEEADKKQISFGKLAAVGVLGGILALGTPFLIGVFAIALAVGIVALGKKIYNYNHKDLVNDLNKEGKKLNNGKESKDKDKINDLANSKNLDELNAKLSKTITEFSKTKEGKALINNEKFQKAVKNACGVDIKDIVNACEKNDLLSVSKNKDEYIPAKDVTEEYRDILDEFDEVENQDDLAKRGIEDVRNLDNASKETEMQEMKDIISDKDEEIIDEPKLDDPTKGEPEFEEPKPDEPLPDEKELEESKNKEKDGYEPAKDVTEDFKDILDKYDNDDNTSSGSDDSKETTEPEAENSEATLESGDGAGSKILSGLKTAGQAIKKGATKVAGAVKESASGSNKTSDSKDKKGKDKDEEEKGLTAGQLKNMFKIFVVAMFLFGAPLTIGLFALGLAAVAGYKLYDWKKNSATKMTRDALNATKEADMGPLPNKYGDYLDLAKNEKGEPATEEEFAKNLMNKVNEFAKSKEGKELLEDPNFKQMFSKVFKEDPSKVVENIDKTLENIEKNKDELEKQDDYVPAKDVTEEYKDILDEYDKDEKQEDLNKDDYVPAKDVTKEYKDILDEYDKDDIVVDDKNSINNTEPVEEDKKLLEIPDDEFPETNPVATTEEVQNSLEASKEVSMDNSLDIEQMMNQGK